MERYNNSYGEGRNYNPPKEVIDSVNYGKKYDKNTADVNQHRNLMYPSNPSPINSNQNYPGIYTQRPILYPPPPFYGERPPHLYLPPPIQCFSTMNMAYTNHQMIPDMANMNIAQNSNMRNEQYNMEAIYEQPKCDRDPNIKPSNMKKDFVKKRNDSESNNIILDDNYNERLLSNLIDNQYEIYLNLTKKRNTTTNNEKLLLGTIITINDKYGFIKVFECLTREVNNMPSKWNKDTKNTFSKKENIYFQRSNVTGYIKEILVGDLVIFATSTNFGFDQNSSLSINGDEQSVNNKYKKGFASSRTRAENVTLFGDVYQKDCIPPLLGKIVKPKLDLVNQQLKKGILEYTLNEQTHQLPFSEKNLAYFQKMADFKLGDYVFFSIVAYPFPNAERTAYNVRLALKDDPLPNTPHLRFGTISSVKDSFGKIRCQKADDFGAKTENWEEVFFHFEDAYLSPSNRPKPSKDEREIRLKRHLAVGTDVAFRTENRFGKEIALDVTSLTDTVPVDGTITLPLQRSVGPPPYNDGNKKARGRVLIDHLGVALEFGMHQCKTPVATMFHGDKVTITLKLLPETCYPPGSSSTQGGLIERLSVIQLNILPDLSFGESGEPRYIAYTIKQTGDYREVMVLVPNVQDDKSATGPLKYHLTALVNEEIIAGEDSVKCINDKVRCYEKGDNNETIDEDGKKEQSLEFFQITLVRYSSEAIPDYPAYLGSITFFLATRAVPASSLGTENHTQKVTVDRSQIYLGYFGHSASRSAPKSEHKNHKARTQSIYDFIVTPQTITTSSSTNNNNNNNNGTPTTTALSPDCIYYVPLPSAPKSGDSAKEAERKEEQSTRIARDYEELLTLLSPKPPLPSDQTIPAPESQDEDQVKWRKKKLNALGPRLSQLVSTYLQRTLWGRDESRSIGKDLGGSIRYMPFTSYRIELFGTGNYVLFRLADRFLPKTIDHKGGVTYDTKAVSLILDFRCHHTLYQGYLIRGHHEKNLKGETTSKYHHKEPDLVQTDDNCYTLPVANYIWSNKYDINLGDPVIFRIDAPNATTSQAMAHTVAYDEAYKRARIGRQTDTHTNYTFGVVSEVNCNANKYKVPYAGIISILSPRGQSQDDGLPAPRFIPFYFRDVVPNYQIVRVGDVVQYSSTCPLSFHKVGDGPLIHLIPNNQHFQNGGHDAQVIGVNREKALGVKILSTAESPHRFKGTVIRISEGGEEICIGTSANASDDVIYRPPSASFATPVDPSLFSKVFNKGDVVDCWSISATSSTRDVFYVTQQQKRVLRDANITSKTATTGKWERNKKGSSNNENNNATAGIEEARPANLHFTRGGDGSASTRRFFKSTTANNINNNNSNNGSTEKDVSSSSKEPSDGITEGHYSSLAGILVNEPINVRLIRQPREPLCDEKGFSVGKYERNYSFRPHVK